MKKNMAILKKYGIMTLGSLCIALAVDIFLAPNKLAVGGISGIATAVNYLLHYKIGIIALILNVPLFVLLIYFEGKEFCINSLYATVMLSVFIDVLDFIPPITHDLLLSSLFGGLLSGLGLGMVFYVGTTTGGSDIIAKLFQRLFRHMSIGKILLIVDLAIILFATIVFKNLQTGLYSIIALYASSYTIDALLEGVSFAKLAFIISSNPQKISDSIKADLKRGVTGINGMGMYSGQYKNILMCTLKRNEIPLLKDIVKKSDNKAFMVVADVREVMGEGFKNYD